jgi:hypothetical protein
VCAKALWVAVSHGEAAAQLVQEFDLGEEHDCARELSLAQMKATKCCTVN